MSTPKSISVNKHEVFRVFCIIGLITLVFGQTLTFEFVNYDDPLYLGTIKDLEFQNIFALLNWAFTHMGSGDWQPIVWLSWMLDKSLYGMDPMGYHLTNVLLHIGVTLLFYLFLRLTLRAPWKSFLVALFFSIHPMRVESVAWVAERKDLLSAFWLMLTLLSYRKYVTVRDALKNSDKITCVMWYGVTLTCFMLGLATKPMLVTLPALLLLFDYWPLERLAGNFSWRKVISYVLEKIPFGLLSIGSVVLTIQAIQHIHTPYFDPLPWITRIEYALVAHFDYVFNLFFPYKLNFFYWSMDGVQASAAFLSAVFLVVISVLCITQVKSRPYLIVGWLWFFIILIPVSGWVPMGSAWKADRYTYFAHIGLLVSIVWIGERLLEKLFNKSKKIVIALIATLVLTYASSAFAYCLHWKDSVTLNEYGIRIAPDNYRAYNNLGAFYFKRKQYKTAVELFEKSKESNPKFVRAYRNLGQAYFQLEEWDLAYENFLIATKMMPNDVITHFSLGQIYADRNQLNKAISHLEVGLKFEPDPPVGVYRTLAKLWRKKGNLDKSISFYIQALKKLPNDPAIHNNLANVYYMNEEADKARYHFEKTLELKPDHENASKLLQIIKEEQ